MHLKKLLVPLALLPLVASAQTSIYNANFSTGALNPATYVVGQDWTVASSKNQTGTALSASGLSIGVTKSTSALEETQARVLPPAQVVTLSSIGDFVTLQFTFTNTNLLGSATSSLTFGLFDSHGVSPRSDLSGSGLSAAADNPLATGGAQGWNGYATRFLGTGSPTIFSRGAQTTETATESQDLLFNDVGSGAFDSPAGTTVGSATSSTITLAANGVYTIAYTISLNGSGGLDFSSSLYSGASASGTAISAVTGTTATPLTTSFDSLAIGFRETANLANPLMKITAVGLTTSVSASPVPEPSAYAALAGVAGLALAGLRRRRR